MRFAKSHKPRDEKIRIKFHVNNPKVSAGVAYPFGACTEYSEAIIKSLGLKAAFICKSKVSIIKKTPDAFLNFTDFYVFRKYPLKIFQ